jgi:DNA (cytosine-5)-methyltransferase 1
MMHGAASLAAADHVDWSVACRSVFARTPALVEATMRRVALGVKRFVLDAEAPYLRPGNGLEAAFVVKHFGGMVGTEVTNPFPTILSRGAQNQLVVVKLAPAGDAPGWHARRSRALLARHAGVAEPTLAIAGARYRVADIGMRLMTPRELYRLQGFPDSYRIDADFDGKPLTVTAQVRMCGNSVSPPPAHALITANLNHQAARMAA